MFIHIEIVKSEYYEREKNENIKQLNNNDKNINNETRKLRQKSGIPRRSPTQVLTGLDVA